MTAKGLRRIFSESLSKCGKNALLQPHWKAREVYSCCPHSPIRACRGSLACEEHTTKFFAGPLLLWTRNTMKTNRGRERPRHTNHPRCTCTDGHVTKLITPPRAVGLVVLSK